MSLTSSFKSIENKHDYIEPKTTLKCFANP